MDFSSVKAITIPEGSVKKITAGSVVLWEKRANYTNLFDPSTATINKRISSGGVADCAGYVYTSTISVIGKTPFTADTKIYIKGATFGIEPNGNNYTRIRVFKSTPTADQSNIYYNAHKKDPTNLIITDEGNGVISVSNLVKVFVSGIKYVVFVLSVKDTAITADDIKDIIVTIDEPIF